MLVLKRDGHRESVKFDKITARIEKLCYGLDLKYVSPVEVAMKVINGLYDGVTTIELDNLAAEIAAALTTKHPDYAKLAARIAVSNLHKVTSKSFSNTMKRLYTYVDPKTGQNAPLISKETWKIIRDHAAELDEAIIYDRDFGYDFFGFRTLERSYLMKIDGKVVERPQHLLMRVAVGIHGEDIPAAIETYNLLSEKWFTHATPTLFNAGTPKPQLSSCFLLTMQDDSIDGIYDTLKQCAKISQSAGGIGLSIHNIRAKGSYIKGTGLLSEYGESHQNETNKAIHWICVPLIFFSVVGLIASIPSGILHSILGESPYANWATVVLMLAIIYYVSLSIPLSLGMVLFSLLCIFLTNVIAQANIAPLWLVSVIIFIVAWIGQFYGHKVEGKKPSFLKDLQFLLIGPAWLMHFIYKKIGIPY
jgi:uncharacterized membrane protein YGL010W